MRLLWQLPEATADAFFTFTAASTSIAASASIAASNSITAFAAPATFAADGHCDLCKLHAAAEERSHGLLDGRWVGGDFLAHLVRG